MTDVGPDHLERVESAKLLTDRPMSTRRPVDVALAEGHPLFIVGLFEITFGIKCCPRPVGEAVFGLAAADVGPSGRQLHTATL